MKRLKFFVAFGTILIISSSKAYSKDLFSVVVSSNGVTESKSYSNVSDFAEADFAGVNSAYTTTSAAHAQLFIRGIKANSSYSLNSTELKFSVPSLGINKTFSGKTRDESQKLFLSWLKKDAGDLLKAFTQKTAIDPVAGNPNSLMSTMATSDFSQATGLTGSGSLKTKEHVSIVGIESEYGQFKSQGYSGDVYRLPLSWSTQLSDSGTTLLLDFPVQYSDVENAKSYAASFGVGARFPIVESWSLTPSFRAGAAGSDDLGAGAAVFSWSLTSTYDTKIDDFDVKIGNMIGYFKSQEVSIGDISLDYNLSNIILRNGIAVSHDIPFDVLNRALKGEVFIINTHFAGSEMYISNYTEAGFDFATPLTIGPIRYDSFKLGASYTFAENYDGFKANFGFKF